MSRRRLPEIGLGMLVAVSAMLTVILAWPKAFSAAGTGEVAPDTCNNHDVDEHIVVVREPLSSTNDSLRDAASPTLDPGPSHLSVPPSIASPLEEDRCGCPDVQPMDEAGQPDGLWQDYWHNSTQLFESGRYAHGRKVGTWERWYENGRRWSVLTYELGQLQGPYKYWHANQTLAVDAVYSDDALTGSFHSYFENGNPELEGSYDRERVGTWIRYHENGKPLWRGQYSVNASRAGCWDAAEGDFGKRIGVWFFYETDGTLKDTVDYGRE